MSRSKLLWGCVLLALGSAGQARADTIGTLYFTLNAGGTNDVQKVSYDYNGSTISYTGTTAVATTTGADGLLFSPNGDLLVAGQANSAVTEVTTGGTYVTSQTAGTGSYHLLLSPDNSLLYTMWNGSGAGGSTAIAALPLSGGLLSGTGTAYTVRCASGHSGCSTDVRGVTYDPTNSTFYYGTAADASTGDFGTLVFDNTAHTATLTPLVSGTAHAHGLTYDPFTHDIFTSQGNTIIQYDPSNSTAVSFTQSQSATAFDQTAVDGAGHLFGASTNGYVQFIDYSSTDSIATASVTSNQFLSNALDDIAPLSGAGSQTNVPEPASLSLMGVALVGLGLSRRRRLF